MPTLPQIDFPVEGPRGVETAAASGDLAALVGQTPGLRWTTWTEDAAADEGAGVHLSGDTASAQARLEEHSRRLEGSGSSGIRARLFDVDEPLTAITHGPDH